MDARSFVSIVRKYKKCPDCGSSWKDTNLNVDLKDEIAVISCKCGFLKKVDKNNKEII